MLVRLVPGDDGTLAASFIPEVGAVQGYLKQVSSLIVTAAVSALVTLFVTRAAAPRHVDAQFLQAPEVRASSFVLVGADGTRRATLSVIEEVGVVNLQLFDSQGMLRTIVGEGGISGFLHPQSISFSLRAGAGGPGLTMWMEDGTPRRVGLSPYGLALFDGANIRRLAVGEMGDPAGSAKGVAGYGIEVRDAHDALLLQLP